MSSTETYFVAATTVTRGPTSSWIVARRSRIASGDSGDHSLAPRDPAVAPVGEEELGMTESAEVGALYLRDAGLVQRELGGAPEIELAPLSDLRPEARRVGLAHLGADLVAARPDPRPDGGRERSL